MSNINQGYHDRIRYILQNSDLGSETITEPIGWNSDEKELERHKDYHGIFPKFSNNLKFIDSSFDYLKLAYDLYGVNVDVRLIKEEKHPKTDIWTRTYDGYLDFSTYSIEDNQISIKFNSGGIEAELKARMDEEVEVTRDTTLDGNALTELVPEKVELDARRIFLQSKLENENPSENYNFLSIFSNGNTRNQTAGVPLKIINNSHEELSAVPNQSLGNEDNATSNMMFLFKSNVDRILNIKLNFSFTTNVTLDDDINHGYYQLNLATYKDGDTLNYKNRITLFQANALSGDTQLGGTTPVQSFPLNIQGSYLQPITHTISGQGQILLLAGESLTLETLIHADLGSNTKRGHWNVSTENIIGSITIEEDSFFEKTISNMLLPFEVADRLIEIYTNKKALKSDALGRTDIGYSEDGKASLIGMLHGFWIRGFDKTPSGTIDDSNLFKPLTTSLKEFMESFSTTFNLGIGIESLGFKEYVRIEELGYFYNRNITIKLPNQVKNIKRSFETEYSYSSIEIGYENGGIYDEAFGLVEYNGKSNFSTIIKKFKNIYSKISKYRSDSFGLEFARRKQKTNYATTDTQYDTDKFIVDVKRDITNIFKLRKYADDFDTSPTGTFSPETAYNLRLSPFNCLLRHGWVIGSGFTKYISDFVRYTSSTANSNLSTKLKVSSGGNGNEYSENGNIINSELKKAKYISEIIEFEHEVDFDVSQMIYGKTTILGKEIPNIYGTVQFINENNELEKGFLMNLKPNGKGTWKILKYNR